MLGRYWTSVLIPALVFFVSSSGLAGAAPGPERHVVVVVWDGMRPDFVSEETTPTLCKLAREGVIFRNHHPVYPSATQVNGTALVTGVYPGTSGVIANYDYRPEIDPRRSISVESPEVVRKGDELSGGKYISVPTIAELIQHSGGRTVIAAAKTVGLLLDRHATVTSASQPISHRQDADATGMTLFAGKSLPSDAITPIVAALGPFPPTHLHRDGWTTKA
ncbi:MAG: alkaline phosphatase family protein, partial [Verrucomicrobia bacterium]|nr:alkaline phosphatase family protein [Verrucomicrobiota bacterium]